MKNSIHLNSGEFLLKESLQNGHKKIFFNSDIKVEVDGIIFRLRGDGDRAILMFNKFTDIFKFLKNTGLNLYMKTDNQHSLKEFLNALGTTVYLQNSYFPVLGPKAGFFFPMILRFASSNRQH